MKTSFKSGGAVLLTMLAVNHLPAADELPSYTFVPITDEQLISSSGLAINDVRQVTGSADFVDDPRFPAAMLWDPIGGPRFVALLNPLIPSWEPALNNSGRITGAMYSGWGTSVFIWEEATGATIVTGGFTPQAMNDFDEVVGTDTLFPGHGIFWNSTVGNVQIGGLREARSINNAGQIVGQSYTRTAVLSQPDGILIDLGVLPGDAQSIAEDISDSGWVVGTSFDADGAVTAFAWFDGVMTPLDESGQFAESRALAVNDNGQVVGIGYDADGNAAPFVWQAGVLINVSELANIPPGITLTSVADINRHGDLTGTCLIDGVSHGYVLLTDAAVPLPPPPVPQMCIDDASVIEGNKGTRTLSFEVTLSPAASESVTVHFATADGTATVAGKDYVRTSGTLTFNPDETSRTINVSVKGDRTVESNETFRVILSDPTVAPLARPEAIGTIINDDTAKVRHR